MTKMTTLNLKSESCEEQIEVPEKLWRRFEKVAKKLGVPPEQLAVTALDNYLKERRY